MPEHHTPLIATIAAGLVLALPDARPTGILALTPAAQPALSAELPMPLSPRRGGETGADRPDRDGAEVVVGNAADPGVLELANLAAARRLFVTIPEAFEAGQVVQQARALNPGLEILTRAHSDDCVRHLDGLGASLTVLGEREIADRMIEQAFPVWSGPGAGSEAPPAPEAAR